MLERHRGGERVCEKERKREGECVNKSLFQREREDGREREERGKEKESEF